MYCVLSRPPPIFSAFGGRSREKLRNDDAPRISHTLSLSAVPLVVPYALPLDSRKMTKFSATNFAGRHAAQKPGPKRVRNPTKEREYLLRKEEKNLAKFGHRRQHRTGAGKGNGSKVLWTPEEDAELLANTSAGASTAACSGPRWPDSSTR